MSAATVMPIIRTRLVSGLLWLALLVPAVAAAQQTVGSSCANLDSVGGTQSFSLDLPVAAGQWIIVSAAASDTSVQFAAPAVTDTAGNDYAAYDATLMAGDSGVLVVFAARAAMALSAGDPITVHYSETGSVVAQGCASAAAFPGVMDLADPSDGYGENYASGSLQMVNTASPTSVPNELVYSAFASASTPGSITALSPAHGLGQACSTDSFTVHAAGMELRFKPGRNLRGCRGQQWQCRALGGVDRHFSE